MPPYDGDRLSSTRPTRDGCPDVLEMVSTHREAWKLGWGLDHRFGNSQSLPVEWLFLVTQYQLARLGPVQRGKLPGLLNNQARRHLSFPSTVGDHLADGGHARHSFASSLRHEDRSDQTLVEAGCSARSREQGHQAEYRR